MVNFFTISIIIDIILALEELQMARMEMGHVQEMLQASKETEAKETVHLRLDTFFFLLNCT